METEIYYFSGTGNSLHVAKELQKRIPGSINIPLVSLMDRKTIQTGGKVTGFVFPVHALTIPIVVKQFIRKLDMGPSEYVFAIATREGTIFRGFEKIDRLLKKKKKRLNSHFILNMCNNEARHPNYKVPSETEIRSLESAVSAKLDFIQDIIVRRAENREPDINNPSGFSYNPFFNFLLEKLVIGLMDIAEYFGGANYFYTDSGCNGCGICEKVCLSKKIRLIDRAPVWRKNVLCYMCFACLNFCPKKSVQINDIPGVKSYTKVNGRYQHPYATVKDIAGQKETPEFKDKTGIRPGMYSDNG